MKKQKIKKIFKLLSEFIEKPESELEYSNVFQLLVAVVLSAQATDKSVNKATKELFKKYITPQDFLDLGLENLKNYIKTIGLYNNKSKNIIETSKILVKDYNSVVPDDLDELIKLPGVGRKTANVILNVYFKKPTMPVDTHVFRLANRIKLTNNSKNTLETEKILLKIVPKEYAIDAHHLLILHGRYTCKARKPLCENCVIYDCCEYEEKTI